MFRRRLTDKMNSPESLDKLLVVVTPRAELTFTALAIILLVAVTWSFIAKIPMTVSGEGILLKPGSIKAVQSQGDGPIVEIHAAAGDMVTAGQVLARISVPELNRQLDRQINEYLTEKEFSDSQLKLAQKERDLEQSVIRESIDNIENGLQAIDELRDELLQQKENFASTQETSLRHTKELLDRLRQFQRDRLNNVAKLVEQGHATKTQEVAVRREVTDTESRITEMEVQIVQQNVLRVETIQQALNLRQQYERLKTDLTELKVRREQVVRRYETTRQEFRQRLSNMAADIRNTQERRARNARVLSYFSGTVLEINMNFGQLVSSGTRLAMLQAEPQHPFFRIETLREAGAGTLSLSVNSEMTPALRYDSTPDEWVEALSDLPAIKGRYKVTAHGQMPEEPMDLNFIPMWDEYEDQKLTVEVHDLHLYTRSGVPVHATVYALGDKVVDEELRHLGFFPVGAGKKVVPGMEIRIDPANIEVQRFGSLVGQVTDVSKYPVSGEGIVNLVGNSELAKAFSTQGGAIMITASLKRDDSTPNGYKWTSKSPEVDITAGITTTSRVTVERRRPVSFVIPLMREWLLGEGQRKLRPEDVLE